MSVATAEKPNRTALELVKHLRDTGTGAERVGLVERFVKDNPGASALDAYEHLREQGVAVGTLRKAGIFATGDNGFEPPSISLQTVDEVRDLREANTELRRQLATKSSEASRLLTDKRRLEKDVEYWRARAEGAARQLTQPPSASSPAPANQTRGK